MKDSVEFVEGLLDETRDELNRADGKASILMAALGIIIAIIGGVVLSGSATGADTRLAMQVMAIASTGLLLIGLVLLGAAVYPSTGTAAPGAARYYADFAQYNEAEDLRRALDSEFRDLPDRHVQQLLELSQIVQLKYRRIKGAIVTSGLGTVAGLIAIALHA